MAAYDGKITLLTQVDTAGVKKGGTDIKSALGSISGTLKSVGAAVGLAFGIGALVTFGKKAVELASDLQEVQNVVDVAFGSMSYKMEEFANKSIETYGISKLTAKKTGSTYMAMARGMGIADGAASDMALKLTGLSADMSSFYNVSQEMADVALKSVFTGETETLKQYGIVMTQVNLQEFARQQGITKSISSMNQQEQVMLRYQYIMQQTALAQGDFARTSDSWANQTRVLSERWKEMQATFGEAFMTIGTLVLPAVNALIKGLQIVANYAVMAAQGIAALFGKKINTETQSTANNMSDMATSSGTTAGNVDNIGKASKKAAKEANKMTAAFDELQILSSGAADSASGGGGSSGGGAGNVGGAGSTGGDLSVEDSGELYDTTGIEKVLEVFGGFKDIDLSPISESLQRLGDALKPLLSLSWNAIEWGIKNVLQPLAKFTIEEVLPRYMDTLTLAVKGFGVLLENYLYILKDYIDNFLKPIGAFAGEKFIEFLDEFNRNLSVIVDLLQGTTAFEDLRIILNFIYTISKPIIEFLISFASEMAKFVMNSAFIDLKWAFKDIEDAIGLVADLIQGDFTGAWDHLKDLMIDNKIDKAQEKLQLLKDEFDKVIEKIKEWVKIWGENVQEFVDTWKTKIEAWWKDNVLNWFTAEQWNGLFSQIGISIGIAVADMVTFWNTDITNWWNNDVLNWFTAEQWKGVFDNITTSLSSFFTADDGFVKTWETKISDWWNNDVSKWFKVEEWKKLGTNMKDGIVSGFKSVVGGVAGILNSIINGFQGMVNGVIRGINKIIEGYNSVADVTPGLPSLNTIKSIDLSAYKIQVPALAKGTVVPQNKEFLAMLGDNKNEPEIVSPLSTMEQAVENALSRVGVAGNQTVVLEIDGREFGRAVVSLGKQESRRVGTKLVYG